MKLNLFKKVKTLFWIGAGALGAVALMRNKDVREKVDNVADGLETQAKSKFNAASSTLNEVYNKTLDKIIANAEEMKLTADSSKEDFDKAVEKYMEKAKELQELSQEKRNELRSMLKNSFEEFRFRLRK
jgi:predicted ATPase